MSFICFGFHQQMETKSQIYQDDKKIVTVKSNGWCVKEPHKTLQKECP